jgi:hypothetical protein
MQKRYVLTPLHYNNVKIDPNIRDSYCHVKVKNMKNSALDAAQCPEFGDLFGNAGLVNDVYYFIQVLVGLRYLLMQRSFAAGHDDDTFISHFPRY